MKPGDRAYHVPSNAFGQVVTIWVSGRFDGNAPLCATFRPDGMPLCIPVWFDELVPAAPREVPRIRLATVDGKPVRP